MISAKIYQVLIPLKNKTIKKIKSNLKEDPQKLNIMKSAVPEINVYGTFERTFSTCLGHKLQEVAAICGKDVVNIDKEERKTLGIDIRVSFYILGNQLEFSATGEGQMKLGTNTQTGTHKKDSLHKLIETTKNNGTNPFFVTALGESYSYFKDGVLYIGGEKFWERIGINYTDLHDTITEVIKKTYDEVKSTIIPTL